MANMRSIRTRIKSVKNTQQITKAMKMVAVSKLRRAQSAMQTMTPFAEKSQEILDTLLSGSTVPENRFISPKKEIKRVCYVLFVGNRGLCGVYNSSLMHFMQSIAEDDGRDISLVICGRWGKDVIARSGLPVRRSFTELSDTPSSVEALEISEYLKTLYLNDETDEIHLVYQHYISALRQEPTQTQLLPAKPEKLRENAAGKDYLFAPDASEVLESVMQLYINNKVYSVMLEAKCGEHSSRMTAMTAATDSTQTLIDSLSLALNRARQAAITTEISEIVGGAAALKKKK